MVFVLFCMTYCNDTILFYLAILIVNVPICRIMDLTHTRTPVDNKFDIEHRMTDIRPYSIKNG